MNKMHGLSMVFVLLILGNAFAQTELIHTGDYYAVSFDGEGDAIVRAKLNIENISKKEVNELTFEFSERTTIFKIVQNGSNKPLEFEQLLGSESTTVRIELNQALGYNQSTQLVLLYRSGQIADKGYLGNLEFDFKTIVDTSAVLTERARVSINVQPGYFVKGGDHEIDYKPDLFSQGMVLKAESMDAREFSTVYGGIEYEKGSIVEEAYNLDQLESFHVKGLYSENLILLFVHELLVAIAVLLAIGIGVLTWVSRQKKAEKKH